MSPRKLAAFCAPVLSVALLAGCGSDDSDRAADDPTGAASSTPTATDTAPVASLPACVTVWRADATLPDPYEGCVEGEQTVPPDGMECSSGQFVVTYDDAYWAVAGGKVQDAQGPLLEDAEYTRELEVCRG